MPNYHIILRKVLSVKVPERVCLIITVFLEQAVCGELKIPSLSKT